MKLNGNYLSDACGIGKKLVVYGTPDNVSGNEYDQSQWRYLGYDVNGTVFRNWLFRSDSRATLHVAKNWVKTPWSDPTIKNKGVQSTFELTSHPDAKKWLESMYDPYNESPTFIQSYNKRTNKGWTGDTLKDYVVIQQIPTKFTPGVIQMWNIWQPDGSYWYEMFYIPPLAPLEVKEQPDLVITDIKTDPVEAAAASWIGDSVTVQITSKNEGNTNSGPFTVGIVGTSIKSEVISNVPPGQIKTVSVTVSSTISGIIKYTAMTDFGKAVTESNENNNTMPFQIVFSKKNEPTTPIAIISHLEGDNRTKSEVTIKPSVNPTLDDLLSYSPGKEAITIREWKYTNPAGKTIATKPVAKDLVVEGKYVVELRVTNSAKKVSEWTKFIINVATLATPNPSTTPEPTPTPRPAMKVGIRFAPSEIIAGETASLLNSSSGFDSFVWGFSNNLDLLLTDKSKYEYYNQLFTQPGTYHATFRASDDRGTDSVTTTLTVIDPKPVAIVSGPTKLIEGREIPVPYHLNNSYTPLDKRGVSIDHSRDEQRYKKVGDPLYTINFPTVNNLSVGQYMLEGKVYDTTNRVSDWSDLLIEVVPDLPPTIEVIAPTEIYRNNAFMLFMDAESPDYDLLQHLLIEERYDHNNNGDFDEESWTTLYDGVYKTTHSLSYATVGKRQYRATVTEDYGKKGTSAFVVTDVLNYTPTVNFNAFGITQQPGQGEDSGPPITNYTPDSIFRSWVLKKPYIGGDELKIGWKSNRASLQTKDAELISFDLKYPNAGMGANGRNKYSLASDLVAKPRWYISKDLGGGVFDNNYSIASETIFNNNRLYLLTGPYNARVYEERDAVTGALLRPAFTIQNQSANTLVSLQADERFYSYGVEPNSQKDIYFDIHNNRGEKEESHSIHIDSVENLYPSVTFLGLIPDHKSVVFKVEIADNYNEIETRYYKYNVKSRSLDWVTTGPKINRYSLGNFTVESKMIVAPNGTIYISGKAISKITPNGSRIDSPLVMGTAGKSEMSLSDDGNYLYRMGLGAVVNSDSKSYFTVYNTSNMSQIALYTSFREYNTSNGSGGYVPLVKEDGTVAVGEGEYLYLFSKTGAFLFRSIPVDSVGYSYQTGILSNGQLFSVAFGYPYVAGEMSRYALRNFDTLTNMVVEPLYTGVDSTYWGTGRNYVTPVLPNGAVFLIAQKRFPFVVVPFVSASGKTNVQEIDADTVGIFDDNWGGLFYDAGSRMKNYALEFNVSVNDITNDKSIGAGIQIQDERNMYAMEWSKDTLSFYQVVSGVKTLLKSAPLTRSAYSTYPIKVESINGTHSVYVNHAKVIEVTNATYSSGFAGIISLGQSNAIFSNVKKTNYGDTYTQETYDTVLVNDPISYEKLFNDIEEDPVGAEEWSYSHNPNFFENPEGLSVHNGNTYGSTVNALEKAGVYEITYRAQDNPGLTGYHKWSEPITKLLYVHRRPVAQPDVRFTGLVFAEGESLDYETYDASYDPDIAHILSDKLFRTRWADQTTWTTGKREYYNRPGVELIIQEQVRDIHGAWSYWEQTIVYKDALPAVNQTKPVMTITVPAGTMAAAPTTYVKEPTIRWTYYDAQNDPQEQYRLTLAYVDTNETILSIEHEGNALTYPVLEDTIQQGRVVKVQGQVYSKGVWSALSNIRYFVLNQPPQTYLLSFNGPDAVNPMYTNSNRPQLRVFTIDPENHPTTAIDYEVYRASSGAKVVDTESATAAASYTPASLAEGLHYWKARANDSYVWGPFSANGFFFVDTVKPADVNEQLEVEPTAVTVRFNAFSDASPSSGHATRTFYLQRVNKDGSVSNIDLNGDGVAEYSTPLALSKQSYRVAGLVPGQEYRVTVLDYDIAGNEGHYAYIHFSTNRPPTGDFDWSPKPVYEGDMTTFVSSAADPDGDTLSIVYELTSPLGVKSSYAYTSSAQSYPSRGPSLRLTTVGVWSMKMLVSDGIAEPIIVTKTIQVLPLQLRGAVLHTELWDQHRKKFNLKASGNENLPRGYSLFWAGEKFVLEADTTLTGTETKADSVAVQFGEYSTTLISTSSAPSHWKGTLWDSSFTKLAKGPIEFTFTAYYNNGTIVTTQVNAAIDGQTINIVSVHRVQ
ncbi:hypothetical protein BK133_24085 [Paenibacillus sp. FSL H8-0548]|nr:hypothetical protein BK133_24085 [Paenibacillus sp. FSL H8-0548]